MRTSMRRFSALSLAGFAFGGVAIAQQATSSPASQPTTPAASSPAQSNGVDLSKKDLPGPIDSIQDLEDMGKMLFKFADTNNDGQISQKEASDAGNLMVGGFFFRADKNGDGVLTKEEQDAARESLYRQQPLLRFVLQKGKAGIEQTQGSVVDTAKTTVQAVGNLIDSNRDNQLQASELRQAVDTSIQGVYQVADTNHDNQLSPSEINAMIAGAANTSVRTAFQTADADNSGQLSKDEFDKAIIQPANVLFTILDGNNDGQISPNELQTAEQLIANQIRHLKVPEPANSLSNMAKTGLSPSQAAPVPNIRTPKENDSQVRPTAGTNTVQPQ